jgi:branched-chain amino acid aminotransferase
MDYFNWNGKTYKKGTGVIGVDSRALRYGDGIFETMKLIDGKILFCNEHFARLWKGMGVLQFELPKHFTPEKLVADIEALAKKNGHENAARIRLSIVRGDGGLYDPVNHSPNYSIQTFALPEGNGQWNSNGLVLGIYEAARKSCDILSNLKHNNYLPYILAALEAKKNKWNDAIVLNTNDGICDTTIANIFLIKDQTIYTPLLAEGCVAGIVRQEIITNLREKGYTVLEQKIAKETLLQADEVFLTNSMYNMRWVQSIGSAVYSNSFTKQIYTAIAATFT